MVQQTLTWENEYQLNGINVYLEQIYTFLFDLREVMSADIYMKLLTEKLIFVFLNFLA